MCYGMGCFFEDGRGECRKPKAAPCPADAEMSLEEVEAALEAIEWAKDEAFQMEQDRRREARYV